MRRHSDKQAERQSTVASCSHDATEFRALEGGRTKGESVGVPWNHLFNLFLCLLSMPAYCYSVSYNDYCYFVSLFISVRDGAVTTGGTIIHDQH